MKADPVGIELILSVEEDSWFILVLVFCFSFKKLQRTSFLSTFRTQLCLCGRLFYEMLLLTLNYMTNDQVFSSLFKEILISNRKLYMND